MGLCKCRQVTNLFCFEHRKNVCEKCILSDHPRCIVRSYLQWLQDSDYDPICGICLRQLDQGELVRLCCLDLFHIECVNERCSTLPEHTAPAGYGCPTCNLAIMPTENARSSIAELVRLTFRDAKWAQNLLPSRKSKLFTNAQSLVMTPGDSKLDYTPTPTPVLSEKFQQRMSTMESDLTLGSPRTHITMPASAIDTFDHVLPRKQSLKHLNGMRDGDEDKYGRRGSKTQRTCPWRPRHLSMKRALYYVLTILVFFLLYSFFTAESLEPTTDPVTNTRV
ncbi:hypothetical protein BJ742DRAFT_126977 [Cladochytrium replicatum]|nr:hypothetical protein BJ742DRAFT_126977 [Cladochytrium replicatum]